MGRPRPFSPTGSSNGWLPAVPSRASFKSRQQWAVLEKMCQQFTADNRQWPSSGLLTGMTPQLKFGGGEHIPRWMRQSPHSPLCPLLCLVWQPCITQASHGPVTPADIAQSSADALQRPILSVYPKTSYGHQRRSFSRHLFDKYDFIECSVQTNAVCQCFAFPAVSSEV